MANIRNSMVEVLSESEIRNYVRLVLDRMNTTVNHVSVDEVLSVLNINYGITADEQEVRKALNALRQYMSIRNQVVRLAHGHQSRNLVQTIISDKTQFSGRDLIMTGVSLMTTGCNSCSWLHNKIDDEIKNRGLTWNSY